MDLPRPRAPQPDALTTPRLRLRRWRESDLAPFAAMNRDGAVMRHFERPLDPEESDASARRLIGFADAFGLGPWAVEVPGDAAFIGFVGAWPTRPQLPFAPAIEVGWRLVPEVWGRGYAPEAARAALRDAFARVPVDEIVAYTASGNHPSLRVMERLGMRPDPAGSFDHPLIPEGHPNRAHVLHRLSRAEFEARP